MIDEPKIFDSLGDHPDFSSPVKRIHNTAGTDLFQTSLAHENLIKIIIQILNLTSEKECPEGVLDPSIVSSNEPEHHSLNNKKLPPKFDEEMDFKEKSKLLITKQNDQKFSMIIEILNKLSELIDETPPIPGPRRYGNLSYRDWFTKIEKIIPNLLKDYLIKKKIYQGPNSNGLIEEIEYYLINSFGSKIRLDYGTGHELNFIAWIGTLWISDVLINMDGVKFFIIFGKYYDLVRKLILTYTLEPAGSHGVWGLDDHFHFIYLLGASQLAMDSNQHHNRDKLHLIIPSPSSVTDQKVVSLFKTKNFYFNGISFINKVKIGKFWETSPILYDISGVKTWSKILSGLLKMYKVEVLNKFPVVQHFYFGGVFYPWKNLIGEDLPMLVDEELETTVESNVSLPTSTNFPAMNSRSTRFNPVTVAPHENSENFNEVTKVPWAKTHKNIINDHSTSSRLMGSSANSQRSRRNDKFPGINKNW